MTRLNLIEGTDEYCIAGLAMGERHVSDSSHEHDRRACDEVRSELGFSMLESTYERALMIELKNAGFTAERQVPVRVVYKGKELNHGYCADIVVNRKIILELKAVTRIYAMHRRQLQFYLSAGGEFA